MDDQHTLWTRLGRYFRQTNTWLLIALLALAGWTVDALRMFLTMHSTLRAGLGAFAGHFWYAIPMILAIVVFTRLQAKTRLLGAVVYDEAGRVLDRRGDFQLDDLTATGMLAALRDNGQAGLQELTLPSGAQVYFCREGGRTLVLSFSGLASAREVAAEVENLQADLPPLPPLLAGLDPAVAALAANTLSSPVKRNLLAFFYQHPQTAFQANDLAYWVGEEPERVDGAIEELATLGLLQRRCACRLTFWTLNRDPAVLVSMDALFSWQGKWQSHLQRLARMVGQNTRASG